MISFFPPVVINKKNLCLQSEKQAPSFKSHLDTKCMFLAVSFLVQVLITHRLRGRIASAHVRDNLYLLNE